MLSTLWAASVLIAAILLLRKLAGSWLPKRLFVWLWDLALARLLIPWSLPILPATPATAEEVAASTTVSDPFWLIFIWAVGAGLSTAWLGGLYCREHRLLRESIPLTEMEKAILASTELDLGATKVLVSDQITTPVAFGFFSAQVVLPKAFRRWTPEELTFAVQHELVHIRRRDNIQKLIMCLALILHWYNPLVWIMQERLDRDIETSCDEKVIALMGEGQRWAYAETLLNLAAGSRFLTIYSNGFGTGAIQERIRSMMKHKKVTVFAIVAAVIVLALAATVFAKEAPADPEFDTAALRTTTIATDDTDQVTIDMLNEVQNVISVDTETGEITDENGEVIGRLETNGDGQPEAEFRMDSEDGDVQVVLVGTEAGDNGFVTYSWTGTPLETGWVQEPQN